ncbi:hypothetical protein DN402_15700 [Streptomyces sp. SW4]|nr:hypothetical protein DN402_15700 [Streptomyces sp. SW4]
MPTPYGSRGGLAFGVEELRVLRRALALALNPSPVSAEDVQDCLRLAESLDEATRESARLRAFLVADLARYRAALPGTAAGYLALLDEALGAGYHPAQDDLAALGALRGNPTAATLLARCQEATATTTATVPAARTPQPTATATPAAAPAAAPTSTPTPTVPAPSRTRLLALPGGLSADPASAEQDPGKNPEKKPPQKPAPRPAGKPAPTPAPSAPSPPPARSSPPQAHPAPTDAHRHLAAG